MSSYSHREQLLSLNDLNDFKKQLLYEIKLRMKEYGGQPPKKWLKSKDVRKLLNISQGNMQNLRVNGTLPFTKISRMIYYDAENI